MLSHLASAAMCHKATLLLIFKPVSGPTRRECPMTDGHLIMVGAATVFVVSDIARSVEHYCDRLGFTVTFQYGKPVLHVCVVTRLLCTYLRRRRLSGYPAMAASVCS